jgi:hypothetical protein
MVASNNEKTVFMPYEATSVLSSLGTVKELISKLNVAAK